MSNVVQLRGPEPMLWVCECGCSTFELMSDGAARCAVCKADHEGLGSGWLDRSTDRRTHHNEDSSFLDIQGNGSIEFARHRLGQLANDPSATLIAVADAAGGVSVWSAAETDQQIEWAQHKLTQAIDLIVRKVGPADEQT